MSCSRFDEAIGPIIGQEGGYSNHPNDSGGPTKWGITLNFYRNNVDSDATKEDIKNLTRENAKDLYEEFFWHSDSMIVEGLTLADLPIPIGEVLLSYTINMGYKSGYKLLQKAINNLGYDIAEDGWLGPTTVEKANKCDPDQLLLNLSIKAADRYNNIVLSDNSQKVFLEGWMRRVLDNYKQGTKLLIKEKLDL